MRLIRCDLCGEEQRENVYNEYDMVYDFQKGYEVCKKCAEKFSSYKEEINKYKSQLDEEYDNKLREKEQEIKEKYGIKFIEK